MLKGNGGKLNTINKVEDFQQLNTKEVDSYTVKQKSNKSKGKAKIDAVAKMGFEQFDTRIISELEDARDKAAMFKLIQAEYGDANGNIDESKLNNKQKDAIKAYHASQSRVAGLMEEARKTGNTNVINLIKRYTRAPKAKNEEKRDKFDRQIASKFEEFKNLKDDETPTMARGGINRTGKAFRSIVSSGELINGRMVPPGGPYITTIPRNGVVINPNSESTIRRQAREEKALQEVLEETLKLMMVLNS